MDARMIEDYKKLSTNQFKTEFKCKKIIIYDIQNKPLNPALLDFVHHRHRNGNYLINC